MTAATLTLAALRSILPHAGPRAATYHPHLVAAMTRYQITTRLRIAAFIAQIGHESGSLRYVREIASGAAYDTGSLAGRLGNTPEADGDGQRYKGRGLIQITGRANYLACSRGLYGDDRLITAPETLEQPSAACLSAGWFWDTRKLNALADEGDFLRITRRINGGTNGLGERQSLYTTALQVLA